jgi:mRNA interferase RelE/StbE
MFQVLYSREAMTQLDDLHEPIKTRILKRLERLQFWPNVSGAKALTGNLAGYFRLRTGDYRMQFYLDGQFIVVDKIGHRDGFYGD